ncbi:MAG: carbonic anhydrase family protein [Pyrinomonadaceae bacterium]
MKRSVFGTLLVITFMFGNAAGQLKRDTAAQKPVVQTKESQAKTTPHQALQKLKEGNARFVSGTSHDHGSYRVEAPLTAKGQYPFAAFVSCIDSRVSVDDIFDLHNGDAFDARVAGNIVDSDILGSLEYATEEAGAKLIVVLGHTHCGGIKGACDDIKLGNLTGLVEKIKPAVTSVASGWHGGEMNSRNDKFVEAVMRENVRLTIRNIREQSEVIHELEKKGKVEIVGAEYDVETGKVIFFE